MRVSLFFLVAIFSLSSRAQPSDSIQAVDSTIEKSTGIFPLPVIYYTPETELAYGGMALFSFRFKGESPTSRVSQFQLGAAYTQRKQFLIYMPFQLYLKEENYFSFGELYYYRYSYWYYGNGSDAKEEDEELYDVNFPRVRINLMKLARPALYVGFRYWMDNYNIVNREAGGILANEEVTGASGGLVSGFGALALYDNRDNYNYPSKGTFLEALVMPYSRLIGSDFEFTRFSLDYVKYLSRGENILAFNLYGVATSGNPPFNEMAFIGGRRKMRGYIEGRFRERNLLMAQAEYRRFLFWRLGVAAFAAYGVVAPEINQFEMNNVKASGGLGLRYSLDKDEKINIRLDIGFGEDGSSGIYFVIGEAF